MRKPTNFFDVLLDPRLRENPVSHDALIVRIGPFKVFWERLAK